MPSSEPFRIYNIESYFKINQSVFDLNYLRHSDLRKNNISDFKAKSASQPSIVKKRWGKSSNASIASFRISHVTVKNRKSFQDGELIKEVPYFFLALNLFVDGFSCKQEIMSAVNNFGLSATASTVKSKVLDIYQAFKFFNCTIKDEAILLQAREVS
jgi:hypothetical protein